MCHVSLSNSPVRTTEHHITHPKTCPRLEILPAWYFLLFVLRALSPSLLTTFLTILHFEEVFQCYKTCSISRVIFAANM